MSKLIHVLIDLRDVLGEAVPGETITFETVKPRESVTGGVVRPRQRLIELDENGCGAVDLEPGPVRVIFHDVRGREVVLNSTVPAEHDIITLRELILLDVGTVDSVPGLRDALAEKADEDHFHHVDDIVGIRELAAALAPAEHQHIIAEVLGLTEALEHRSRVDHLHTLADMPGLAEILDAKVNVDHLKETVDEFAAHKIAEIVDGAPESLDTLREVAAELANQTDSIQAIFAALAERAMKSHTHDVADVTNLQSALDSKATTQALTTGLAGKADKAHKHAIADVTNLQTTLDSKATTQALTTGLAGKADKAHKHAIADVTNLQTTLDSKAASNHSHSWAQITGKPSTFAPASHKHNVADVNGLQSALDGKANVDAARLSGPGWVAHRRSGVVTVFCNGMAPDATAVLPVGWRPPEMVHVPLVGSNLNFADSPALKINPDGTMTVLRANNAFFATVTYVAPGA